MFERISRGWTLTKTSLHVLRLDPEIMWLPILAGVLQIAAFVVLGLGAVGLMLVGGEAGLYLGIFVLYVAVYAIVIFFNAAVIEMAHIRFSGGDPVLMDGLRKSWSRIVRILQWALVAATVGVILRILRDQARNNMIARMLVGFLQFGWTVATFFVVPVLVFHDKGPIDAIKDSTSTVKRVWGEGLTGVVTTGLVFFLFALIGLVPLAMGVMALGFSVALGFALMAFAGLYWIALLAAKSAVDGILVAALYKFSVDGRLPEVFREAHVDPLALAA